jgi:aspartyl-tRNA(Asn)/glutamyl-tRNA(Gln) amidotransferase subunit C
VDITREEVVKIARLAKLRLSPEEVELYRGQLLKILESMKELSLLDTAATPPTASVLGITNVLRPDVPVPCPDREPLLANAPRRDGPYFRVPKVIE